MRICHVAALNISPVLCKRLANLEISCHITMTRETLLEASLYFSLILHWLKIGTIHFLLRGCRCKAKLLWKYTGMYSKSCRTCFLIGWNGPRFVLKRPEKRREDRCCFFLWCGERSFFLSWLRCRNLHQQLDSISLLICSKLKREALLSPCLQIEAKRWAKLITKDVSFLLTPWYKGLGSAMKVAGFSLLVTKQRNHCSCHWHSKNWNVMEI